MEESEFRQIFESFLVESEEQLSQMEAALLIIEEHPQSREPIDAVFRLAHSLKGAAASVGQTHIASFTHGLEDLVECLHARRLAVSDQLVSRLLAAVDALREMLEDAARGESAPRPAHGQLRESLDLLALAAPPAPPALPTLTGAPADEAAAPGARASEAVFPDPRPGGPRPGAGARTLRVEVAKLDHMIDMMGELAIARGRLQALLERGPACWPAAVEAHEQTQRLFAELAEEIASARMVPVGSLLRAYARMVRDTAHACGKLARLVVQGGEVGMDTAVLERLREPLTHLLRNAIDHGLETPEARRAAGKPPHGRILVAARREGGQVVLTVGDDGQGLACERVVERARARGIAIHGKDVREEAARLIFEPGLSTSPALTELSGRGIGMDVIRREIEALRGGVSVESHEGQGTTFTLRLPLTLATIEGLVVRAGDETYVIPMESIVELVELPPAMTAAERVPVGDGAQDGTCPGQGLLQLRGEPLPWFRLRSFFGLGGLASARESVVVVDGGGRRAGVVVDELCGVQPVVVKPLARALGPWLGTSQAMSVSTILSDGRAVLVLDVPGLLREVLGRGGTRGAPPTPRGADGGALTAMIRTRAEANDA